MNIVKINTNSRAPVPEDFGFDFSVYSDYEKERRELINNFEEEQDKLGDIVVKHDQTIKDAENNTAALLTLSFLWVACCAFYFYAFSLIFGSIYISNFIEKYFLVGFPVMFIFIGLGFISPLFLEEKLNVSCFVRNIFTFGKYKIAQDKKKEIEDKIIELDKQKINILDNNDNEVRNKVSSFEKTFRAYYQNELDEFYSSRLYKKRSGTAEFEESLAEFSAIIDDLSEVNKVLLTKSFDLWEYRNYLEKRKGDHLNQQNKVSDKKFLPLGEFVKNVSEAKIREEKLTPEEKYRIPRKIDWENINKSRRVTGLKGEEIVVEIEKNYLQEVGRIDLVEKVRHVAKEDGDGAGYDILSFFKDGREKYIEVKSSTKSLEVPYYISRNELSFLQEHTEDSFIYRLLINHENIDYSLFEINSAVDLFATKELEPVQYVVKKLKLPVVSNSHTEAERY